MATHFTVRHTFRGIDVDGFWEKVFFDEKFNETLYRQELGFSEYQVLEQEEEPGGVVTRKVRQTPKSDAPAVVKKLIGDSVSYVEEGRFDPATKRWRYSVTPSKMADKIDIGGEFWVEARGEDTVERICTVDLSVKVFGVGKSIESFIEKQTKDSYETAARYTQRFIDENLKAG